MKANNQRASVPYSSWEKSFNEQGTGVNNGRSKNQ